MTIGAAGSRTSRFHRVGDQAQNVVQSRECSPPVGRCHPFYRMGDDGAIVPRIVCGCGAVWFGFRTAGRPSGKRHLIRTQSAQESKLAPRGRFRRMFDVRRGCPGLAGRVGSDGFSGVSLPKKIRHRNCTVEMYLTTAQRKGTDEYVQINHCLRCHKDWCYRGEGRALRCGQCGSPYWDRPKKERGDEVQRAGSVETAVVQAHGKKGMSSNRGFVRKQPRPKKVAAGVEKTSSGVKTNPNAVELTKPKPTWFPNSICPHGYMNSFACQDAGGGCKR
jgi:hypothetical protein